MSEHYRGHSDPAKRAPALSLPQREPRMFCGRRFVPLIGRGQGAGNVINLVGANFRRLSWKQWHACRAKIARVRSRI